MHHLKKVLETLIKLKLLCYFSTDVFNSYWAVSIKPEDEYKAEIITSHGQYTYWQMSQGLKGASHIYSQFTDLVFESTPWNNHTKKVRMLIIIKDHRNVAMASFMNNHAASVTDFESLYEFLEFSYFSRVVFRLIYLNLIKTAVFSDSLNLLSFTRDSGNIRPSIKH